MNEPTAPHGPAPKPSAPAKAKAPLRETFAALWNDYPWMTRAATILLIATALINISLTIGEGGPADWIPLRWLPDRVLAVLASDGMLTLLTLTIALGIGLYVKERQLKGLLDGTDHYDIGRALAFGYFSNFLVPALLLVRGESQKAGKPLVLRMVFPATVQDLDHFKETIEPALRELSGKRDLEGVYRVGAGVIKRSLLVLSRSPGGEIYFDFPTTLYTLHDYYETWNQWLEEQDKPPIREDAIESLQARQIGTFLRHLRDLFRSEVGLAAVKHLGVERVAELTGLFDAHFRTVEPHEMLRLLDG